MTAAKPLGPAPLDFPTFLTARVIFDTTIPLYFARIGRGLLLAGLFRDRAVIPQAVRNELHGLANDYPQVRTLLEPKCFARIVNQTDEEWLTEVDKWLRGWKGVEVWEEIPNGDDRGEAECLVLCDRLGLQMVAQDNKALRGAIPKQIQVFSAIHVCLALKAKGGFSAEDAWRIYLELTAEGLHAAVGYGVKADEIAASNARFMALAAQVKP
jgi:predicted nucleic acid-binding protein